MCCCCPRQGCSRYRFFRSNIKRYDGYADLTNNKKDYDPIDNGIDRGPSRQRNPKTYYTTIKWCIVVYWFLTMVQFFFFDLYEWIILLQYRWFFLNANDEMTVTGHHLTKGYYADSGGINQDTSKDSIYTTEYKKEHSLSQSTNRWFFIVFMCLFGYGIISNVVISVRSVVILDAGQSKSKCWGWLQSWFACFFGCRCCCRRSSDGAFNNSFQADADMPSTFEFSTKTQSKTKCFAAFCYFTVFIEILKYIFVMIFVPTWYGDFILYEEYNPYAKYNLTKDGKYSTQTNKISSDPTYDGNNGFEYSTGNFPKVRAPQGTYKWKTPWPPYKEPPCCGSIREYYEDYKDDVYRSCTLERIFGTGGRFSQSTCYWENWKGSTEANGKPHPFGRRFRRDAITVLWVWSFLVLLRVLLVLVMGCGAGKVSKIMRRKWFDCVYEAV